MAIKKTVFQVVVLHEDEYDVESWDISEVIPEMQSGAIIGQSSVISSSTVDESVVVSELVAIGNDGTFFEYEDNSCPHGCPLEIDSAGDRFCLRCGQGWDIENA